MPVVSLTTNYAEALEALNYTPEQALKDFLILTLSERITNFQMECEFYHAKYGMTFSQFSARNQKQINQESFREEDDFMAWKFAEESLDFLQTKLAGIK